MSYAIGLRERLGAPLRRRLTRILLPALAAALFLGQTSAVGAQSSPILPYVHERDYTLGPGDVVEINVADSQEITGKYRVSNDGYIALPLLTKPLKVEGLSAQQLSTSIAKALEAAQLFRQPAVTVFVDDYRSQTVTVLGAVEKPSVYPLRKPTTLLEGLSMAGGLLPSAGNRATILRGEAGSELSQVGIPGGKPSKVTINLAKLMNGRDPSLNLELHGGDIITVPAAPIIYVVGAVRKPGGFALQDASAGLTILQALGLAAGLAKDAAPSRSIIIRSAPDGGSRRQIPFNVGKLLAGKIQDAQLQGNDILFIPESSMKESARVLGKTAQDALTGIAIYGLGLRIGRY